MDANRTTLRYSVELDATLVVAGRVIACEVRDVSLGGAFVAGLAIDCGTRAVLRFGNAQLAELALPCVARWHDARGSGLQFDGCEILDCATLARVIRVSRMAASDKIPE